MITKFTLALLLSLAAGYSCAVDIKINPGKYGNYYHIQYELIPGEYRINESYGFNEGGQFEVLVPKEHFPIKAPNCNMNIIIRMPWSQSEAKKKALYEELKASKRKIVVLELNPYIKALKQAPLEIELEYCNVFFRHKGGDYYDAF